MHLESFCLKPHCFCLYLALICFKSFFIFLTVKISYYNLRLEASIYLLLRSFSSFFMVLNICGYYFHRFALMVRILLIHLFVI